MRRVIIPIRTARLNDTVVRRLVFQPYMPTLALAFFLLALIIRMGRGISVAACKYCHGRCILDLN